MIPGTSLSNFCEASRSSRSTLAASGHVSAYLRQSSANAPPPSILELVPEVVVSCGKGIAIAGVREFRLGSFLAFSGNSPGMFLWSDLVVIWVLPGRVRLCFPKLLVSQLALALFVVVDLWQHSGVGFQASPDRFL